MTNLNELYNPNDVEVESRDFERVPDGEYQVLVEKAEVGETRSGFPRLELTYQIKGGEQEGRKLWDNLILKHDNEQVETISKSTIKKLFVVTSGNPNDTQIENLQFKPFTMKVKSKERKDGSGEMDYVYNIQLSKDQWALMRGDAPKQSGAVATGPSTNGTNWDS